jgi:hypothetical protein
VATLSKYLCANEQKVTPGTGSNWFGLSEVSQQIRCRWTSLESSQMPLLLTYTDCHSIECSQEGGQKDRWESSKKTCLKSSSESYKKGYEEGGPKRCEESSLEVLSRQRRWRCPWGHVPGLVGGLFAATGLTQASVDKRLHLAAESVAEYRLETESPINDFLIYTTTPGRLFVQAKTNLSMAKSDSDDMM